MLLSRLALLNLAILPGCRAACLEHIRGAPLDKAAEHHARLQGFYNRTQPYDHLPPGAHNVVSAYFQRHWHPTLRCQRLHRYPATARLDGKQLCDLPACLRASASPLVISVGSNGIFTFEDAIRALEPRVEIHTIDGTMGARPDLWAKAEERHAAGTLFFHDKLLCGGLDGEDEGAECNKARAANQTNRTMHLSDIARGPPAWLYVPSNGAKRCHPAGGRVVNVLKIDCEGCEFGTYRHWFDDGVCIEQIAVEVHAIFAAHCKRCDKTVRLREAHDLLVFLTRNGYELFAEEHTPKSHGVLEMAFVRRERCPAG